MSLLGKLDDKYLYSSDHQFGIKPTHYIFMYLQVPTLKEVMGFYKSPSPSVYNVCFKYSSITFDDVKHWAIFKKTLYHFDGYMPEVLPCF